MNPYPSKQSYTLCEYLIGGFYFTIYGIVKYMPSPLCDPLRWFVLKFFMGALHSMRIKDGATFWFPKNIRIGRNVSINEWVFIDGFGGVEIGDDCRIAHGCSFLSEDHNFAQPDIPIRLQGKTASPIQIGRDCWFGAGVRVLKGVKIGNGCVVGAGAVVTRDLPPFSVAVGIPARVVGFRGAK